MNDPEAIELAKKIRDLDSHLSWRENLCQRVECDLVRSPIRRFHRRNLGTDWLAMENLLLAEIILWVSPPRPLHLSLQPRGLQFGKGHT